jgi:hypothetical protein
MKEAIEVNAEAFRQSVLPSTLVSNPPTHIIVPVAFALPFLHM